VSPPNTKKTGLYAPNKASEYCGTDFASSSLRIAWIYSDIESPDSRRYE
jgi:hypothetical protein